MKKKSMFFSALITLILVLPLAIPFVQSTAYITYNFYDSNNNPAGNVQTLAYTCADATCTNLDFNSFSFSQNSGSNSYVTVPYPTSLQSQYGYAAYYYAQCHLPKESTANWAGSGSASWTIKFDKAQNCHSPITQLSVVNTAEPYKPLTILVESSLSATTYSAFRSTGIPEYVPPAYKDEYYSAQTRVTLTITNKDTGQSVYTESRSLNLFMDTNARVEFTWTPQQTGNYIATIQTDVTDCQCASATSERTSKEFTIISQQPPPMCYTILNQLTTSSQFPTAGQNVLITVDSLSNYMSNSQLNSISAQLTLSIYDTNNNIVKQETRQLNSGSTTQPQNVQFSWTPTDSGWYSINVNGLANGAQCNGITNNPEQISQTIFVYAAPAPNQPPVAVISANPTSGFAPLAVQFASQSYDADGSIVSYSWNFGDGIISSVQNPSHTYNSVGNYAVVLTVTDNSGATGSASTVITVSQMPNTEPPRIMDFQAAPNPIIQGECSYLYWTIENADSVGSSFGNINSPTVPGGRTFSNAMNICPGQTTSYTVWAVNNVANITRTIILNVLPPPPPPNQPPVAVISANPTSGFAPLAVQFASQSYDADGSIVSYSWNFGDGVTSNVQNPSHTYNSVGSYTAFLIVADNSGAASSASTTITILPPLPPTPPPQQQLNVSSLQCFQNIIVDSLQACTVYATSNDGQPVGNALISIYDYSSGQLYAQCTTDRISGGCNALYNVNAVGNFTIYATAQLSGYINDTDKNPTFAYNVMNHRYDIINLGVFNDSNYFNEDYDYLRAEPFYVKFRVADLNNNNQTALNMITQVTLISPPGGRIDLEKINEQNGWYYYRLQQIPPTHSYLGLSQVFTFAFNFSDNSGGEKIVNLTIRNNPPKILATMFVTPQNTNLNVDLSSYEYDIEDKGSNLSWSIVNFDASLFTAVLNGKSLTINPLQNKFGNSTITLKLTDLDGDSAVKTIPVFVTFVNQAPQIISAPITELVEDPAFTKTYVYDVNAVDPNNDALTYTLITAPAGMTINLLNGIIVWKPAEQQLGLNAVKIQVSDGSLTAVQQFTINVLLEEELDASRQKIALSKLEIVDGDCVNPGSTIKLSVGFENKGIYEMEKAKISATIMELAERTTSGPFSLNSGSKVSRAMYFDVPKYTAEGYYNIRVSAGDDKFHRIKYREFVVKNKC